MDIKNVGSNMTEVGFDGNRVLYSYSTPVAAWDNAKGKWVRTDKFWSQTTSRHINKWLKMNAWIDAVEVPQIELDKMVA